MATAEGASRRKRILAMAALAGACLQAWGIAFDHLHMLLYTNVVLSGSVGVAAILAVKRNRRLLREDETKDSFGRR